MYEIYPRSMTVVPRDCSEREGGGSFIVNASFTRPITDKLNTVKQRKLQRVGRYSKEESRRFGDRIYIYIERERYRLKNVRRT